MLRAVCTRAQVQRLKESRLTIRGCEDEEIIKKIIFKILNVCAFDYAAFSVSGKVGFL